MDRLDFAFVGALLLGVGAGLELTVRKSADPVYRWAAGVALAAALRLVWIDGAVGIIGSESDDVNLLYGGVLVVGLVGAAVPLFFRARGMA